MMARAFISLITLLFAPTLAFADLSLQNIDSGDLEDLASDFSANFMHTTISGAAPEGAVFGFQLGLMAGITETPSLKKLAAENGDEVDGLPHGAIVGIVSVPFGLTIEANFLPTLELEGGEFNHMSLALKWTALELAMLQLAVRGSYTTSDVSFVQSIGSAVVRTEFETKMTSLGAIASFKIPIVEPYLGVALVNTDATLKSTGSQPVFAPGFTTSSSASTDPSTTHIFGGVELSLLVLNLGIEVGKLYDSTKTSLKLTVGF